MNAADRQSPPVFRFAPSPNGPLHLGHAFSAFLNHDMAKASGGRFLLRIEDIDVTRCTPAFEQAVYDDLTWLGLDWERPARRQSDHIDLYRNALDDLIDRGLAYPAFMTRGQVKAAIARAEAEGQNWPRDPDGAPLYPPEDRLMADGVRQRRLAAGERHAWRLDMEKAIQAAGAALSWHERGDGPKGEITADPAAWGDIVLWRSDAPASYHLAVVLDDARQEISHVVRGLDLLHATSVHRLLQELLGLPAPRYHHHRLILGADGRKLSKSEGSTGLETLRREGASALEVRRMVGL